MTLHADRMARARRALDGLALGDAFGERFFGDPLVIFPRIEARRMDVGGVWRWTDDTAMALALVETLEAERGLDAACLATRFFERYTREPWRGYGGGRGSFGNGAAMRVAPLGGYYADDLDLCAERAARSASPTHTHPEGVAGAVAIAVAAACAWRTIGAPIEAAVEVIWREVLARTPTSEVKEGLERAHNLGPKASLMLARDRLGNGSMISAQDTVPFCVWSACKHLRDYEAALWGTVEALGDRDTTCAIVGGVVALANPEMAFPADWLTHLEPLEGIPLSNEVPLSPVEG